MVPSASHGLFLFTPTCKYYSISLLFCVRNSQSAKATLVRSHWRKEQDPDPESRAGSVIQWGMVPRSRIRNRKSLIQKMAINQCCESVTFWYTSGSADPYHWVIDADPIRVLLFLSVAFKMSTKIRFFSGMFLLSTGICTVGTLISVFEDNELLISNKTV